MRAQMTSRQRRKRLHLCKSYWKFYPQNIDDIHNMSKTTPQQNKSTCLLLHKVRKISLTLTSISACVQFLFPKQNY